MRIPFVFFIITSYFFHYNLLCEDVFKVKGGYKQCSCYKYQFVSGILDSNSKELYQTMKFDERGRIIESKPYGKDLLQASNATFKYDERDNILEEIYYKSDSSIYFKYIRNFDKNNELIECSSYYANNLTGIYSTKIDDSGRKIAEDIDLRYINGILKGMMKEIIKFDSLGNEIERKSTSYDEKDSIRSTYESIYHYDNNRNRIEELRYDTDGILWKKISKKYDSKKNIIEETDFETKNNKWETQKFKYDDNGNIIKLIRFDSDKDTLIEFSAVKNKDSSFVLETYYENDEKLSGHIEKKFYDKNDNIIKDLKYNHDGSLRVSNFYRYDDNGNLIEYCQKEPEGKINSKYTCKFDEYGNDIEYVSYNRFNEPEWMKIYIYSK